LFQQKKLIKNKIWRLRGLIKTSTFFAFWEKIFLVENSPTLTKTFLSHQVGSFTMSACEQTVENRVMTLQLSEKQISDLNAEAKRFLLNPQQYAQESWTKAEMERDNLNREYYESIREAPEEEPEEEEEEPTNEEIRLINQRDELNHDYYESIREPEMK
jgi:hypothetical protein